jgi:hypothetical protein
MTNIIKLPKLEFILKCKHCKTNVFYIYLNNNNPFDIKGYECCECGRLWDISENTKELIKVGNTPAGCVIGNPYCDCRAGQRCKQLPPPLKHNQSLELTGEDRATSDGPE